MTTEIMRMIDYYFGNLGCYILSGINCLFRPFATREKKPIKEILIMKYFGIGSILLSTPMFRATRETFPGAKITFLTFSDNREICEILGLADTYLYLRKDNFKFFFIDLLKVLRKFIKHRFDVTIDMEFFSKFPSIMTYLSLAAQRIGFCVKAEPRTLLYTTPVHFNCYRHITEIFLSLARAIGADTKDLGLPTVKIGEDDKNFVEQLFHEYKIKGKKKIIININVSDICIERRWPKDKFILLINSLSKYPDIAFIFIGVKEDAGYVQSAINCLDKNIIALNLSGETPIGKLIALFEASDLFITSDSGPLHLAELATIKTIAFFGPETPVLYGSKSNNHIIFYKNLYCSPCLNAYNIKTAMQASKRCREGSNKCMQSITVEEVLGAVKKLLNLN